MQAVGVILSEENLGVAVRVSKSDFQVQGLCAVDATGKVALGSKVIPVGKVCPSNILLGVVKGLDRVVCHSSFRKTGELSHASEGIAALDDESPRDPLALVPANGAVLGVGGDALEDDNLFDLRSVVVGFQVEAQCILGQIGMLGKDVVVGGRPMTGSFRGGTVTCCLSSNVDGGHAIDHCHEAG